MTQTSKPATTVFIPAVSSENQQHLLPLSNLLQRYLHFGFEFGDDLETNIVPVMHNVIRRENRES